MHPEHLKLPQDALDLTRRGFDNFVLERERVDSPSRCHGFLSPSPAGMRDARPKT
jgi:hypothetical protein